MRQWALLALAALAIAGVLALAVAFSRTPGIQDLLPDGFFRAALVTHVVFSFVVWYLGVLGVVTTWAASGLAEDGLVVRGAMLGPLGLRAAIVSFVLLLVPFLMGWGTPSLNNYVPILVHPAFYAGLVLLFAAVAAPVVRLLASLPRPAEGQAYGAAAAGLTYLLALTCFGLAWLETPRGFLDPEPYNETVFWGGGHILQFVNTALAMVAWQAVGERLHLVPPLPERWFRLLMAAVATAALAGPALYVVWKPTDGELVQGFTWLFWFAIAVQPAVMMVAVVRALVVRGFHLRSPAGLGLTLSVALFAVGGVMGYFVGHGDTRTPAHYHLMIGGVMLAFMTYFVVVVLPRLQRSVQRPRWVLAFLWAYGIGQLLHGVGLFWAGTMGIARKTAGQAQGLDSIAAKVAMGVMGAGALVAVIGGILFVWIVGRRLLSPGGALETD